MSDYSYRRDPDLEDIIMNGVLGILTLVLITTLVYAAVTFKIDFFIGIGCILGLAAFIYGMGWCICHRYEFYSLFQSPSLAKECDDALPDYGDPIINRLIYFEHKYQIDCLQFMSMVKYNQIPTLMRRIDNLDYIEWLSLINDLPTVREIEAASFHD